LKYERSDCIKYIFVGSSLAGDPTTCPSALWASWASSHPEALLLWEADTPSSTYSPVSRRVLSFLQSCSLQSGEYSLSSKPWSYDGLVLSAPVVFFFFFFGTGVWTQGFKHARQALYHLSPTISPSALVILKIGSYFLPRPAWTPILLFEASCCP
jgi:hypothetical protein